MAVLFGAFVKVHVAFRPARRPEQEMDLPEGATVGAAMAAAGQPVDGTLAVRAGVPVPEDAVLADGDALLLLSSFSGG